MNPLKMKIVTNKTTKARHICMPGDRYLWHSICGKVILNTQPPNAYYKPDGTLEDVPRSKPCADCNRQLEALASYCEVISEEFKWTTIKTREEIETGS